MQQRLTIKRDRHTFTPYSVAPSGQLRTLPDSDHVATRTPVSGEAAIQITNACLLLVASQACIYEINFKRKCYKIWKSWSRKRTLQNDKVMIPADVLLWISMRRKELITSNITIWNIVKFEYYMAYPFHHFNFRQYL